MARMPGTRWRGEKSPERPMTRYDIVCVHTIVGFAPADAAHFSTYADGRIDQSRDTKYQSGANLDGNHRVIAIENEDHGPRFGGTPQLPKWVPLTPEQVTSCAEILAFAHREHGIPLQLCPNSKPGSRGLAYHRQGIDGAFGPGTAYPNPGRVAGGEVWTTSPGKVCPTDVRINQLPEILKQAKALVNPTPVDTIALAAVNMPRGHGDKIHTPWPARGVKAAKLLTALAKRAGIDGLVVGWSEFPSRAVKPLRENGVRLSRARANYVGAKEKIGNAIGYVGKLVMVDKASVRSVPFIDNPHGRTELSLPVRLFRTRRGGGLVVVQVHDPVIRNIDKILNPDDPGMRPVELIHQLNSAVLDVVRKCVKAGFVVAVLGDFNGHDAQYGQAGGRKVAGADVQAIYVFGDARTSAEDLGELPTHGVVTDHGGGSPVATVDVPPWTGGDPKTMKLPSLH